MYEATVTGKRQITVPLKVCEKLKIVTGDVVCFSFENDKIIFSKKDNGEDICPVCNIKVYFNGNHISDDGKMYHMNCWFDKKDN